MSGINLSNLEEAFAESEDVLRQMLELFQVQAGERLSQLEKCLSANDAPGARTVLHSLVNIAGAVRAFTLSDLAKSLGEALKRDDADMVRAVAQKLNREGDLVLLQTASLLAAARTDPQSMWSLTLPGTEQTGPAR